MPVAAQVLHYLINEAKKVGKKEAEKWVHKKLKEYGYDAYKVAERLGKHAINGFRGAQKQTEGKHQGPMECGWHKKDKNCPQKNLPAPTQAAAGQMDFKEATGMSAGQKRKEPEEGGEQQVTKPHHIWRRFPNTDTAALKWIQSSFGAGGSYPPNTPFDSNDYHSATSLLDTSGGGGANDTLKICNLLNTNSGTDYDTPQLYQLRMTSPYNILKSYGTLNSRSTANSQPTWLEFFDSKYQYYHVMETEWEITFHFGTPNDGTNAVSQFQNYGLYIFWKYTNEDDPPTQWTSNTNNIANADNVAFSTTRGETIAIRNVTDTIGGGTANLTCDDYFRMGGWHHKRVTFNTTHPKVVSIEGKYLYGQCKMDIKTLMSNDVNSAHTTAEGWGLTGATPAFPECLSIIVVQDCATNNQSGVKVPTGIRMETEQLIQFKDLRSAYKFPTPGLCKYPASQTLNTDAAFFWRGAGYT